MPFIFISYSHKDREYANRLADSLEAKGLDTWLDERIDYGETWSQAIEESLDRCAAFVVVMTPDSKKSEWVQNELAYAMSLRKPVFPLQLAGPIWLAVAARHAVSVTGGGLPPASFYSRLAAVLSAGQVQATVTTSLRERLQTELGELQPRYDNLTRRIGRVDTDLGRALDGEHKLTLEERRAELACSRDLVSVRMAQIERELAEQEASAGGAQASQQKAAAPPAKVAKVETRPVVQIDSAPSQPAKPVEPARPDLLIVDKPLRLELVRVPAGEFVMRTRTEDIAGLMKAYGGEQTWCEWETPQHRLSLPEFYIGKYPVTVSQFAGFAQAQSYQTDAERDGYGWIWTGEEWQQEKGASWRHPRGPKSDVGGKGDHPVTQVTWGDVRAFCRPGNLNR